MNRTPEQQTEADGGGRRETALWHPQAKMSEVKRSMTAWVKGEGAYLWDGDGNRLLDLPASLWYANIGHGRGEIADAVAAQMRELEAYNTYGPFASPPAEELADRLRDLVPIPDAKIFFGSGGSDAVETAAKLVLRFWNAMGQPQKRIVVSREKGYHGLHLFGTSVAGIEVNRAGYGPLLGDTALVATNEIDSLRAAIERHGADRIAAFICEPVVGGGGVIPPPPLYLQEAQELCRENDILFVVDEVVTGFGRTGEWFAAGRFELEPDLITMAKGITSGYLPLGATAIGRRVWEPFWEDGSELVFRHGLTYSGHHSACRAALANLDVIEREGLVQQVVELEPVLWETVRSVASHEHVTEVRGGVGLLAGIDIATAELARAVVGLCYERGMLTRLIGDGKTLHISPPFVITAAEIESFGEVLMESLDSAREAVSSR
jgi:adenosylmethionine-8-amino-7-oxononanoate aminotransferase